MEHLYECIMCIIKDTLQFYFFSIEMRYYYHNYIVKILNIFDNKYKSYKILIAKKYSL